MNTKIYLYPSFYSHILNAFFLLLSGIVLYNNYNKIKKLDPYYIIILLLLISIGIGIHGIMHIGLEYIYNFNPLLLNIV